MKEAKIGFGEVIVEARVIRADGTIEDLGEICRAKPVKNKKERKSIIERLFGGK